MTIKLIDFNQYNIVPDGIYLIQTDVNMFGARVKKVGNRMSVDVSNQTVLKISTQKIK